MRSSINSFTRPTALEGMRCAPPRLLVVSLFAVLLVVLSLLTVLRYSADHVNADTILYSIQSVQKVDLYFWGQNRFASAIPLLASPFADPDVNLFVVLLLNALFFMDCCSSCPTWVHQCWPGIDHGPAPWWCSW
jgi:hypothetical protein